MRCGDFFLLAMRTLCVAVSLVAATPLQFAAAYDIVNRWTSTQLSGGGLNRGDATRLRWSIVPDGQSYSRSGNSQAVQFLDDGWNVPAVQRTPNFVGRPWWTVINNAYAQYGRVSGVTLTYIAEQTATGVPTGMSGDVRIGGENIDGTPGGALADNTFPNDGDMRLDTTRETDGSVGFYFSTEPGLRNLVIHETGHGVGLGHAQFVNNSAKAVMEGGLRTDIWGLQFDDVYALNRQYGDPREQNGGNDIATSATQLGSFGTTGSVTVGLDAVDSVVEQFDDDWAGIDGFSDRDWFKFTVSGETFANVVLTPIGPTYETVQQGVFNAARQNDLVLTAYAGPAFTQIATTDLGGIGEAEQLGALYLPAAGEYLFRVTGKQDANQFYSLALSLSELPVAGTSADLDFDNAATILDWELLQANSYGSLAGLTARDAFMHGDLDHDGDNDFADFRFFKAAFDMANGAGAFARMIAAPEPATGVLAALAGVMATTRRRRRAR